MFFLVCVWQCQGVESVSLPVLSQELDTLLSELNALLNYFGEGQMVPSSSSVEAQPVVAKGPADSFIIKNFGDKNLRDLSLKDLKALLSAFARTYKSSDVFYSEYQMWAAYIPTRYWELQLLAEKKGAANAFSFVYLNTFRSAYLKNNEGLKEPYKSQLASIALEFSITYEIARADIHRADNNLQI